MSISFRNSSTTENYEPSDQRKLPVEVGLVLVGQLDDIDQAAIEAAQRNIAEDLRRRFPEFDWTLNAVLRPEMEVARREDPVALLHDGQMERDVHRWDFVLLITGADLIGRQEPFVLAIVSRTLDLAVISTARIDPHAVQPSSELESRVARITNRLQVLMMHCIGSLNGLTRSQERHNLMWDADNVDELDSMAELTADQIKSMSTNLRAIADLRLEERTEISARSQLAFYLRAAWTERREVLGSVLEAMPWLFPLRLSRLSTAAVSSMLVLLMTAETWDMAMSQSAATVATLLLVALGATTVYVVTRQQLLVRRQDRLITEQIAVSNLTTTLTVLCGLATTLIALFAVSLLLSQTLFSRSVIEGWAASVQTRISFSHYLRLCGVVAGFSLCIGALGAAFEDQAYFRHVTFVDEEL